MKCLECGKEFKSITNTHLAKCCGLTMKEYAIKHALDLSDLLSEETKKGSTPTPRSIEKRQKTIEDRQVVKSLDDLTDEEEQVLLGTLLGDGFVWKGREIASSADKVSTYIEIEHGIQQIDYLLYKCFALARLGAKFHQYYRYNTVKDRFDTKNIVRTVCTYLFGRLANLFYTPSSRKVEEEVLNRLDEHGLAIWYQDDGSLHPNGYAKLATQSFTEQDNIKICDFLETRFNLSPSIKKDGKDMPYLKFNKEETDKLFSLIEPHIHPSLQYKVGKEDLPVATVCKKVVFDSAHFLDEYDGKCARLHGGRYELWVKIKGAINPETGMVMDYTYLNKVLKKYIVEKFDHHAINYQVPGLRWRSTTELMCLYIWKVLVEFLPGLFELELHETPNSKCVYRGPSLEELKKGDTAGARLLRKLSFKDKGNKMRSIRFYE